jgi:hypothetical protein
MKVIEVIIGIRVRGCQRNELSGGGGFSESEAFS